MGPPWCAREEVESRQWWGCGLNLKSFKLLLKLWNFCQHLSLITFSLSLSSLYTESSIKQHLAIWIETKLSFLQFQFQKVIFYLLHIVADIFCSEQGTIHQKECSKISQRSYPPTMPSLVKYILIKFMTSQSFQKRSCKDLMTELEYLPILVLSYFY